MQTKRVKSLREAIALTGLKSGMSISFHHHLRNGDHLMNMALHEIAEMGIRELTLNASSIFDIHAPTIEEMIERGVIAKINTNYMSAGLGRRISEGLMAEAVGKLLEYLPTRGVRHIYACCFQENEPSRRLIEKSGFVLEGEGTYDSKSLDRTFPSYEYVYEART